MEFIRNSYYEINDKFKKYKSNISNSLLIEIYDEDEERDFFVNELKEMTKKFLYNHYEDFKIPVKKNKRSVFANVLYFFCNKFKI
jgi:hypothetical protein